MAVSKYGSCQEIIRYPDIEGKKSLTFILYCAHGIVCVNFKKVNQLPGEKTMSIG